MRFAKGGFAAAAVAVIAGCDSHPPLGLQYCGSDGECPPGKFCDNGVCGTSPFDAPVDEMKTDAPVDAMIDANPACLGGDGVCLPDCVGQDPDCTTTCGDGTCVGNAGELCPACPQDCRSLDVICGNGQCQTGEAPECYADCGPSPWLWTAQENELFVAINQKRTGGHACPNMAMTTAPAMNPAPNLLLTAREWAWEISHHEYIPAATSGNACNGRTLNDRAAMTPFAYEANIRNSMDAADAVDGMLADPVICPRLMSPGYTLMVTAVALGSTKTWLVLVK